MLNVVKVQALALNVLLNTVAGDVVMGQSAVSNMFRSKRSIVAYFSLFVTLNFLIFSVLVQLFDHAAAEYAFNGCRVVIFAFLGWVVGKAVEARASALLAVVLIVSAVDHVLLKGGSFLLEPFFFSDVDVDVSIQAFWGVLISFVIYFPVVVIVAWVGAIVGRRSQSKALVRTDRRHPRNR